MAPQTFLARGLTCAHCAAAVAAEVGTLSGVNSVDVNVVNGGDSIVTVEATRPLEEPEIVAALDEAGAYTLVRD